MGIAVSDPTGTIANPLTVIQHVSRLIDAASIVELCQQQQAGLIIVGQALGADDEPTPQSRRAGRLADTIRSQTGVPVLLWDESGSTQAVRQARRLLGASRKKLSGHFDDLAATYLLQSYLDAQR